MKIATLLDPRYKNHPSVFPNVVERVQNRTLLITELNILLNPRRPSLEVSQNVTTTTSTSCHEDAMSAFLSCASSQPPTENYESVSNLMFENEIDAYFKVTS